MEKELISNRAEQLHHNDSLLMQLEVLWSFHLQDERLAIN